MRLPRRRRSEHGSRAKASSVIVPTTFSRDIKISNHYPSERDAFNTRRRKQPHDQSLLEDNVVHTSRSSVAPLLSSIAKAAMPLLRQEKRYRVRYSNLRFWNLTVVKPSHYHSLCSALTLADSRRLDRQGQISSPLLHSSP